MQKRVLAIHDISCFGRCSLTVALPIISACGIECTCLPTSILSTHTGGIKGYTFRDLSEDIKPIVNHWKSLDLKFDAFYTGYLGSKDLVDLIISSINELKDNNSLIYVDPVMADNGRLYVNFADDYPKVMRKLCELSDVIVPNITEACFLIDVPYQEGPYTKEYIENLLIELNKQLKVKKIILTGVFFDSDHLGAATYDNGKIDYYFTKCIEGYYHGTGDVFGSCALSCLMKGFSLKESAQKACDFTLGCIERTVRDKTNIKYGVNFEEGLSALIKSL